MDDFTSADIGFTSDFEVWDYDVNEISSTSNEPGYENYAEDLQDDSQIVAILKEIKDEIRLSRGKEGESEQSTTGTETGDTEGSGDTEREQEPERENTTEETTDQTEINYTEALNLIIESIENQNETLVSINDNIIMLGKNNSLSQKITISILSLLLGIIVIYVAIGKIR